MKGREQIGARLRFEILRRCNFACYYCGVPASLGVKQLHIDHVVPVALGGGNEPWNLVAACWDCNAGKTNGMPTDELIRRVREDCAVYLDSKAGRVTSCKFCAMPVQQDPEDEDERTECYMCNSLLCHGFDAGSGRPSKWMAP